jgi:dTDP-glucose 4,6-dehydratase
LAKSKVLVTGGAGFIGSTMVRLLLEQGYLVVVLDALTYATGGNWDNIDGLRDVRRIQGDVRDLAVCTKACKGCEYVVHFAAESHVTRSETEPDLFRRVNAQGTGNIIEAAYGQAVRGIIHVSTDEVYGPIANGYFLEGDKEVGEHQATSPYAKSKAIADDLAIGAARMGAPVIVARPTNNYGPRQHPEKMIPRSLTKLLRDQKIEVWDGGDQVRDWLSVEDCCRAIHRLMERGQIGEAYNIGANNDPEVSNLELARLLVAIAIGHQAKPEEWIEMKGHRPGHDLRYAVDTTKIRALGWQPEISLVEGLERTALWYAETESIIWWQNRIVVAEQLYAARERR